MERVIGLTGIGGQGIQLAARTVAEAAVADGLHVQLFASYGGMMRGGNSDSYLAIADTTVSSPPVPGSLDGALIMHAKYAADIWGRLRPGALAVVNSSVVDVSTMAPTSADVFEVAALSMAEDLGSIVAASQVATGVLASLLGAPSLDALVAVAATVLPSYRQSAIDSNIAALRAGWVFGAGVANGVHS